MAKRISAKRGSWTIVYSGGAYADIRKDGRGVEVLNFWNYDTDAPDDDAPRTTGELGAALEEWLKESSDWLSEY
jgi:hypothetical protein